MGVPWSYMSRGWGLYQVNRCVAECRPGVLNVVRTRCRQTTLLNFRFVKSGRLDSNQRPPGPKPGTLPDCATPRITDNCKRNGGCHRPIPERLKYNRWDRSF